MTKTVLVPQCFTPSGYEILKHGNINAIKVNQMNETVISKYGPQIDGAIVMLEPISNNLFSQAPHLKIVARLGAGYNNIDLHEATKHGVVVTNTPEMNYEQVAEAIIGSILLLGRDVYQRHLDLMNGHWNEGHTAKGASIEGQTLGIIGYGRIGKTAAKKAAALGMKILVNNGSHHKQPDVGQEVDLDTLLRQSDFVSLSVPVTPETTGMINQKTLSKMKPSASLINFGRGDLIVHDDIVVALKNHEIHSAALDTFHTEPLPVDDELLKLDNAFLTPHIGGSTVDAIDRGSRDSASEVVRVLSGNAPQWQVNK